MKTACRIGAAMIAWLGFTTISQAQEVEWKQTINMPKGQNIPSGSGDILGIELGDSYADVKTKLKALLAEGIGQPPQPKDLMDRVTAEMDGQNLGPAIQEQRRVFRIQMPGASQTITASFVAKVTLERQLKGTTDRTVDERIEVHLSAPSSGHQVLGVIRSVSYNAEADQPRILDLLEQLKKKIRSEPQLFPQSGSTVFRYQFNDGKPFTPAKPSSISCQTSLFTSPNVDDLKNVNPSGDCDALLEVTVHHGISRDHAKSITFTLNDNERTKANLNADFAYVSAYLRDLQDRTRGATPKL